MMPISESERSMFFDDQPPLRKKSDEKIMKRVHPKDANEKNILKNGGVDIDRTMRKTVIDDTGG